jgi:hypothetical protein
LTIEIEALKRLEQEIRGTISAAVERSQKATYQHSSGRRLFLDEVLSEGVEDGPVVGALAIVYSQNSFMAIDRIEKSRGSYKKKRRIILYLDSKPGQIGSALLLELLKVTDGDEFSKHKFVQKVDEGYFRTNNLNISSGEINEALSRMFRKTLNNFFGIEGRNFVRRPFVLKMQEISLGSNNQPMTYENYKNQIDGQTNDLIRNLTRSAI